MEKEPALEAISWQCAKNKMRNLRSTYVSAETWRNNTGSGLMERGDEASVRAHILKMSPYYDILGTIYGHRQSVAPSYIIETNDIAMIPSDPDDEQVIEDVEVLPVNLSETNESINIARIRPPINRYRARGQKRLQGENVDPMNKLLRIQEQKVKIEADRLEFEREKEKNHTELRKMELENEREGCSN